MAAPLLQAQVDIVAPASNVWPLCPISGACREPTVSLGEALWPAAPGRPHNKPYSVTFSP
jgi:hypothetical protein